MNEMSAPASANVERLGLIASRSASWMKFLGVLSILQGVLVVLTLWGILVCWLPIWLGVILFRAADDAELASRGDGARFESFLNRLNRYWLIQGIVALMGLVAAVIGIFALGLAGLAGLLH